MSKRGRITLDPRDETEAGPDMETADEAIEPEADYDNDFTAWSETAAGPGTPAASWKPQAGTLIKVAIAGLAAAAVFLLWKNRRP